MKASRLSDSPERLRPTVHGLECELMSRETLRVSPTGTCLFFMFRNESSKKSDVALYKIASIRSKMLELFAAPKLRGLERKAIAEAMASFPGVKRRGHWRDRPDNIVVVEDFPVVSDRSWLNTVEACEDGFG